MAGVNHKIRLGAVASLSFVDFAELFQWTTSFSSSADRSKGPLVEEIPSLLSLASFLKNILLIYQGLIIRLRSVRLL